MFAASKIKDLLSGYFEMRFYGFGTLEQVFTVTHSPDSDSHFRIHRSGTIPPDPESVQHYLDNKGNILQQSDTTPLTLTQLDSGSFQYLKPLILEHLVNR